MANGLVSAGVYGGPQEALVDDPNAAPVRQAQATVPVTDEEPTYSVPTPADVAPDPSRNIAEESNWMQELQTYAQKFTNENEREKFIERASKYTRNNIAMQKASNNLILQHDRDALDRVLYDTSVFQGRGPRNDQEATQVNPAWPAMSQMALDHSKNEMQKRIDAAFKHNSNVNVPFTTQREGRFNEAMDLITKAATGDPKVDKQKVLMQLDPSQLDLDKYHTDILRHELGALKSQKEIDNQMGHYMTVAGSMLDEAHIFNNNPKQLNQLKGALAFELKELRRRSADPMAPIDDNDVLSTVARLIRDKNAANWFGSSDRGFEVPDDFMTDENRQDFVTKYHREPIPEDWYRLYHNWKVNQAR